VIVVDTSAVIAALAGKSTNEELIRRLSEDGDLHAPHLIDVEVVHVLRRLATTGDLTQDRAEDVRSDFSELSITRYAHHPLTERMWVLRHNLTAYDAAFVALAEALAVPLVTCDSALASATGHQADIQLFHNS
jgi:predicted nucleic acid-binding protein